MVVAGRDWSKVKIDGYRPAPPPPSTGRPGSFSSSVDSPLTDLARPHSSLNRSGSASSQSRMLLASASADSMRRESATTLASTHSRGSISSAVTDFTIRSAGSGGTGETARRVPPPTPPPAGPLPTAPSASGVGASAGQVPLRTGSATGCYAPTATASPTKPGMRMRTGSFGAGAALRAGSGSGSSSGPVQPSAARGVYSPPARIAGLPMQVTGANMLPSGNGSGSSILSPSATGTAGAAEGEKETPAERRRRMRGKVAAVDLGKSNQWLTSTQIAFSSRRCWPGI